ncbi:sugar phosphate nucleotidyltransferase [Paenibacillus flagellatus]|uniref:Mannose-1-phosphate guanylyltransferase n=1 Tax=Paenibacillus flagellatus TaxID=2211139 RepID=A0A2V5KRD4_9BACL|nr:sugar phosphate nucleotidyltransferase [Paenibacillus flagellatus]PYI51406.1 mannose-1-phosphate guanylyltransferase [Paenibacillus flagellatus]
MKIILLSGGSGMRLWPMTGGDRPKQLLRLLRDEKGRPVSMLQHVWERLRRRGLERSAVIATSAAQRETIREQLGESVDLVLEPVKRDTYPAVLLAVAYLHAYRGLTRDEPVLVMPVDSLADESFYDEVFRLPETLDDAGARLALIGIKPREPAEKYGYIVPEEGDAPSSGYVRVGRFREKPHRDEAERLMEAGALWNGGVFCFRGGYLLDRLERTGGTLTYEETLAEFPDMEQRSFDHAVVECERSIAARVYEGSWSDLGTWCSLVESMPVSVSGRAVASDDCVNTHIVNETNIPVVAIGLADTIIAVGPEGVLVSRKQASMRLKDALSRLAKLGPTPPAPGAESATDPPVKTLDRDMPGDGITVTTRKLRLERGESRSHGTVGPTAAVAWTIVRGSGRLEKEGVSAAVSGPGFTVTLGPGETGVLTAEETLDIIEVSTVFD